MSFHNNVDFDLLVERPIPFDGFGKIAVASKERVRSLMEDAGQAKHRIEEGFDLELDGSDYGNKLESIISGIWDEGWNPKKNNIELFVSDFGLVLTSSIMSELGGKIIFRSDRILNHLSVWWKERGIEAFPFHKVFKRFSEKEGESIAFFVKGLRALLRKGE